MSDQEKMISMATDVFRLCIGIPTHNYTPEDIKFFVRKIADRIDNGLAITAIDNDEVRRVLQKLKIAQLDASIKHHTRDHINCASDLITRLWQEKVESSETSERDSQ